jgi:hypothetical protein
MSKRFFFAPIIGDGLTIETAYRSALADVPGVNIVSYMPSNPDGTPRYAFALSRVASVGWADCLAVPGVFAFPEIEIDVLVSAMHPDDKQAIKDALDARGIDWQTWFADDLRFGSVIYAVAQRMQPGFNLSAFDVAEVAQ